MPKAEASSVLPRFISQRISRLLLWALWLPLFAAQHSLAHPDFDAQLRQLDLDSQQQPADNLIRLRRADIYAQQGKFSEALQQTTSVPGSEREQREIRLARAYIYFESGQLETARALISDFLKDEPEYARGWLLLGRSEAGLRKVQSAVEHFQRGLKLLAQPNPDEYLELARWQSALGRFEAAVATLEEGGRRLGSPALALEIISLQRQAGDFQSALERTEKLLAASASKPELLQMLRAELLEQSGRLTDARTAFRALAESKTEAQAGRRTTAAETTRQEARAGLARVEGKLKRKGQANTGGIEKQSLYSVTSLVSHD